MVWIEKWKYLVKDRVPDDSYSWMEVLEFELMTKKNRDWLKVSI